MLGSFSLSGRVPTAEEQLWERVRHSMVSHMDIEGVQEEDPTGLGSALTTFQHKEEVLERIRSLPEIYHDASKVESDYQDFMKTLDLYQENPKLLDTSIFELTGSCLNIILASAGGDQVTPLKNLGLKYLRHIFKVYRTKRATQRMPHEITLLDPVLNLLESVNVEDINYHESASVLIYWLSQLVANPFELGLLDGNSKGISVAQRILNVCMKCIVLNNNAGSASYVLLAKILTRPDMLKRYASGGAIVWDLESFIDWGCKNMKTKRKFTELGALSGLAAVFHPGKRTELIPHAKKVLDALMITKFQSRNETSIRKLGVKLIQRVGMVLLKDRVAAWRYSRGTRRLIDNLQPQSTESKDQNANDEETDLYEDIEEFSDEVETILDILLKCLKDKDYIVRWSAAKGVSRIVNRIPKAYGNQIVDDILKTMTRTASSGSWAGACLALAELGRKGLLLPEKLPEIIDVVKIALFFEEAGCGYGVSRQVRDCANYVVYQFARSFKPEDIKPFIPTVATSLILVALFDREINCRRGAAAAFQENVGRQGEFPHGMAITEIADYTTVANRVNAFTRVSVEIAQYKEYLRPMIDHLTTMKFCHTDPIIRELTSTTLRRLVVFDTEYVYTTVMDRLLSHAKSKDVDVLHGSILCIASVVGASGLCGSIGANQVNHINSMTLEIMDNLPKYSLSENLLREALCQYIENCSITRVQFENGGFPQVWLDFLYESVFFNHRNVQKSAASAISALLVWYSYLNEATIESDHSAVLSPYFQELASPNETRRIGAALVCEYNLSIYCNKNKRRSDHIGEVLKNVLTCATKDHAHAAEYVESRKLAIRVLGSMLRFAYPDNHEALYKAIFAGLNDYTTDKSRGDVGAVVREQAITAAQWLIESACNLKVEGVNVYSEEEITKLVAALARLCAEKIDNLRISASNTFVAVLNQTNLHVSRIPHLEEIKALFPKPLPLIDRKTAPVTFEGLAQLLKFVEFRQEVLTGFITTGGSVGGRSQAEAVNAILAVISTGPVYFNDKILDSIVDVLDANIKNERIAWPLMRFVRLLLEREVLQYLSKAGDDRFSFDLMESVKESNFEITNADKIIIGMDIYGYLLQGNSRVVNSSLRKLVILLCHPYPRLRVLAAEKLVNGLTNHKDNINKPNMEAAIAVLQQTNWNSLIPELQPCREQFCGLLKIPVPKPPKTKPPKTKPPKTNPPAVDASTSDKPT